MKSLVLAFFLFSNSLSSALTEALTAVLVDPYLIWPYVALAVASALCTVALPTYFRHLNEPVAFGEVERMEGKQQPAVLANAGTTVEGEHGVHSGKNEKIEV